MRATSRRFVTGNEARQIVRSFPSFRDFVDDALFHPAWGYYSTGQVRFGDGGHYDTFPIALSPFFGRMLARYAYRLWRRLDEPAHFEICELGAGNGQLCLDTMVALTQRQRRWPGWNEFAAAASYRIIERSPALMARQQQTLGALASKVTWTRADLSRGSARPKRLGTHGLVFANEVLDCLAHHKIVPHPDGGPGIVFVLPETRRRSRKLSRQELAKGAADRKARKDLRFSEVVVPVTALPQVDRFLHSHYPELYARPKFPPYFACPGIEMMVRNAARLYGTGEMLWIDYGDYRAFHLHRSERLKVFAGPPRSGASVYDNPGEDDITFMVDFSVATAAAQDGGWSIEFYGPQGELARRSGVRFDRNVRKHILEQRLLRWMLAVIGVGPERNYRSSSLTWDRKAGRGGRVRDDVRRAVDEFRGRRSSFFKLLILRKG